MNFTQLALVFLGGGIGASMRWLLSAAAARLLGTAFPAGTFAVNLIGCFLMGLVVEYWSCRLGLSENLRLFLTTGLLGGFTTFSSFALDSRRARRLGAFRVLCAGLLGLGAWRRPRRHRISACHCGLNRLPGFEKKRVKASDENARTRFLSGCLRKAALFAGKGFLIYFSSAW